MSKEFFPTNPTSGRGLVFKKARSDTAEALACARLIAEPWYRAQALAAVARYADEEKMEELAQEALDASSEQDDPYNVVAASAWPVRALIERQMTRKTEQVVHRLLVLSDQITHPVSRLEALFLLWQAVYPMGGNLKQRVQDKFVAACQAADSWKAGDRLGWAATIVASDNPKEAIRLAGLLREGRYKHKALREISAGSTAKVREFFSEEPVNLGPA